MKRKNQNIEYHEVYSADELDSLESRLVSKAKAAAKRAYAPYSDFKVGAAVWLENGEIITGNNQENSAFPSGNCAEVSALNTASGLFPAVPVKIIAIAAFYNGKYLSLPVSPCGNCRQVMLETQTRHEKNIRVILFGSDLIRIIDDVNNLLPFPFEKPE